MNMLPKVLSLDEIIRSRCGKERNKNPRTEFCDTSKSTRQGNEEELEDVAKYKRNTQVGSKS